MNSRGNRSRTRSSKRAGYARAMRAPIFGDKTAAHVRVEHGQKRAQGRTPEPFDDGVGSGHHMVVDRVPDVEMGTERLEQIVIGRGFRQIVARRCRQPDLRCPRPGLGHLAHEGERRLVGIVRHLQRQDAALRQPLEQTPQHRGVIGNPLKHGVGEQQIRPLLRIPGGEIGLGEGAVRQSLARLAQHVGRGIQSDDFGLRIACDQKLGGIAGPAAEIDHASG